MTCGVTMSQHDLDSNCFSGSGASGSSYHLPLQDVPEEIKTPVRGLAILT